MAVISNGTTLIDNGALDSAVPSGKLLLISSQTASSSSSISFDISSSLYDSYIFYFVNVDCDDGTYLQFQTSTDGGSTYATTVTSSAFNTQHNEAGTFTNLGYASAFDQAQGTSFHYLTNTSGATSTPERTHSGHLKLFNPYSTTFVKSFIGNTVSAASDDYCMTLHVAGYFNDTNDLTNIKFQSSSGNINSGIIKMYAID
jgi:hypothetical protein